MHSEGWREEAKGKRKFLKFTFFLPCHKTCILFHIKDMVNDTGEQAHEETQGEGVPS